MDPRVGTRTSGPETSAFATTAGSTTRTRAVETSARTKHELARLRRSMAVHSFAGDDDVSENPPSRRVLRTGAWLQARRGPFGSGGSVLACPNAPPTPRAPGPDRAPEARRDRPQISCSHGRDVELHPAACAGWRAPSVRARLILLPSSYSPSTTKSAAPSRIACSTRTSSSLPFMELRRFRLDGATVFGDRASGYSAHSARSARRASSRFRSDDSDGSPTIDLAPRAPASSF